MIDQPTSTSSLEEARKAWVRDPWALNIFRDPSDLSSYEVRDAFDQYARGWAAARAEVIREVEAALTNQDRCDCDSAYEAERGFAPRDAVDHAGDCPVMERWDEFRTRLRALSQGGEANG